MLYSFNAEKSGIRIDFYIASRIEGLSRTFLNNIIKEGRAKCNGKPCKPSYKTNFGDKIDIDIPEPESTGMQAQNIPLDILYEDEWLTVINKPRGLVVHPAPGHKDGTLVNALLYHYRDDLSDINGRLRPGIVHRIDKDTSGLLLVVRRNEVHIKMAEAIARHEVLRTYKALCCGIINENQGTIDLPIGRDPVNRLRNAVVREGRKAITHFVVLERFLNHTYTQLTLETGRTHQIRVHMSHIGHPILGDTLYGGYRKDIPVKGQLLHASRLEFIHPVSNRDIIIEAPVPEEFNRMLKLLGDNR